MKITFAIVSSVAACLIAVAADAQFVKGNEAVQKSGSAAKVETPPVPASMDKVCSATANCYGGAWNMVETSAGLAECTEPYARPSACRTSTYGAKKLPRMWVVKVGPTWRWCQYPDIKSKCVDMFARPPANLPYDAVQ